MTTQNMIENVNIANEPTNTNITSMTGLTGVLKAPSAIQDANSKNYFTFVTTGTPVNYIEVNNAITGAVPTLNSRGTDSSIGFNLAVKNAYFALTDNTSTSAPVFRFYNSANTHFTGLQAGTLSADTTFKLPTADGSANFIMKTDGSANLSLTNGSQIAGTATNDSASAGNIGEFVTSQILIGAGVSLANNTAKDITSISLTAGDWDLSGNAAVNASGAATQLIGWISTTSATLPDLAMTCQTAFAFTVGGTQSVPVPYVRVSVNTTTTVYLSCFVSFSSGTATGSGGIFARRAR